MILDVTKLHTNQRLFVEELLRRSATVKMIDPYEELLEVSYNGKTDFVMDRFSSKVSFHSVKMSGDKFFTKNRLNSCSLSTPKGNVFIGRKADQALEFAKDIYPVVLKPNWGSHGDFIKMNLENSQELELAILDFVKQTSSGEPFIIEEYCSFPEHRIFYTIKGEFACVNREPASVIGDNIHSIEHLVKQENKRRRELKQSQPTSLCPIVLDDEVSIFLKKQSRDVKSIPVFDEKVFLRGESNLAKGGLSIDKTDDLHPSYIEIAKIALEAFPGMPVIGLDVLIEDVSQPALQSNYRILELNSSPGLAMHAYPSVGNKQPVDVMLVNAMFD